MKDNMFPKRKSKAEGLVTSLLAGLTVAPLAAVEKVGESAKGSEKPIETYGEAALCLALGLVLMAAGVWAILDIPLFGDVIGILLLIFGIGGCGVGIEAVVRIRRSRRAPFSKGPRG